MIPAFFEGMPGGGASRLRVLLAEDEFLLRLDAADSLRRLGWEVVEVSSADEAIDLLRYKVRFDLLLTDIQMPGSADGLDLARYARAHQAGIKIVIMSATRPVKSDEPVVWDLFLRKPVWNIADELASLMKDERYAG